MQEQFILAAGTLISLALTYAATVGCVYLKARISELRQNAKVKDQELLKIGLETAEKAVESTTRAVVGKLEQVTGESLREAVKNGKADRNELLALAEDAYQEIMNTVSPELISILQQSVRDVEQYVKNEIECQVRQVKQA